MGSRPEATLRVSLSLYSEIYLSLPRQTSHNFPWERKELEFERAVVLHVLHSVVPTPLRWLLLLSVHILHGKEPAAMKRGAAAQQRGSRAPARKRKQPAVQPMPVEMVPLTVDFSNGPSDVKVNLIRQQASTVQKLVLELVTFDALRSISKINMPQLLCLHVRSVAQPAEAEGSTPAEEAVAVTAPSWWSDRGVEGSTLTTLHWECVGGDWYASNIGGEAPALATVEPITSLFAAHRYTLREVKLENIDKKYNDVVRESLSQCTVLDSAELPCSYVSHLPRELPADLPADVKVPPVGPPLPASLRRLILQMQCGSMFCLERLPDGLKELMVQSFAIDGSPVLPILGQLKGLKRLELQIGWGSKKESVQARRQLASCLPGAKVTVRWMLEYLFGPEPPPFF